MSNNDGAIVEPAQPTEPRCDCPQCSTLEKPNPLTSGLVQKRKTELRILNLRRLTRIQLIGLLWPAYAPILESTYYG